MHELRTVEVMRHRPSFRAGHREPLISGSAGRHAGTTTASTSRGGLLTAPEQTAPEPDRLVAAPRRRPAGPPNPTVGRPRGHAVADTDGPAVRLRRGGARR